MRVRILDALGVSRDGLLAAHSSRMASQLLAGRCMREHILVDGDGSRSGMQVVVPLYRCGVSPDWQRRQDARLSLLSVLACWRAGGIVAPVTASLLAPPVDINGYEYTPETYQPEVSCCLGTWRPSVVLSFGRLEPVLGRASQRKGVWSHRDIQFLRPLIRADGGDLSPRFQRQSGALFEEHDIDDAAVELSNGRRWTFSSLLDAVDDHASGPAADAPEAVLVELLRAARMGSGSRARGRSYAPEPWWAEDLSLRSQRWPPRRLASEKEPSPWKPVMDHLSGEEYYWNTTTGETTWDQPVSGRESASRASTLQQAYAVRLSASSAVAAQHKRFAAAAQRRAARRGGGASGDGAAPPSDVGGTRGARRPNRPPQAEGLPTFGRGSVPARHAAAAKMETEGMPRRRHTESVDLVSIFAGLPDPRNRNRDRAP